MPPYELESPLTPMAMGLVLDGAESVPVYRNVPSVLVPPNTTALALWPSGPAALALLMEGMLNVPFVTHRFR